MLRTAGRLACVLSLPLALQGCFFVFIPGSVMAAASDKITGAEGNNCVSSTAKVGDRVTYKGQPMKVQSLSGTSSRCTEVHLPIRALLVPEQT